MIRDIECFIFIIFITGLATTAHAQWQATTPLPQSRWYLACCAYNGYVYAIGGEQSSVAHNNVWYNQIQIDGSLSAWLSTTNLPGARMYHGCLVYSGYLFVLGGWGSGSYRQTVWSAEIQPDGSIGTWSSTTDLPAPRSCIGMAAYNEYVYIIGGYNGSSDYRTVWYAHINGDGSLGSWDSTTSMPATRRCHKCCAYDGYIYITGGHSGMPITYYDDVWFAQTNPDGTIGAWVSTTDLPSASAGHGCCPTQYSDLMITGGQDLTHYFNTAWTASIQGNGELGPWISATDLPEQRSGHGACVYGDHIYVIGGTNWSGNLNTVRYTSIPIGVLETDEYQIAAKQISVKANPNIIRNSTMIEYQIAPLSENGLVSVKMNLYDSSGRLVHMFIDNTLGKGCYHTHWKPTVKPGVYFLSLATPFAVETMKIVVVK